jgi:hypothetical protein
VPDPDHAVRGTRRDARQQPWPPHGEHVAPRRLAQLAVEERDPVAGAHRVAQRVPPLLPGDPRHAARRLLEAVRVFVDPHVHVGGVSVVYEGLRGHRRVVRQPAAAFGAGAAQPFQGFVQCSVGHRHTVQGEARLRSRADDGLVSDEIERIAEDLAPAWRRVTEAEHRWPAAIAIAALIAVQWLLPDRLNPGPPWLLPVIEVVIIVVLIAANPVRMRRSTPMLRTLALGLIGVASLGTAWSVAMLIRDIVTGHDVGSAARLLGTGAGIYLMNVLTFAVWFWELDRGGPIERSRGTDPYPDFLFPPMTSPDMAPKDWEPQFLDYLYVSFTNATAFSPTDTLPLSRWAKTGMALESAIALVTAALVVAKAVNTLQ